MRRGILVLISPRISVYPTRIFSHHCHVFTRRILSFCFSLILGILHARKIFIGEDSFRKAGKSALIEVNEYCLQPQIRLLTQKNSWLALFSCIVMWSFIHIVQIWRYVLPEDLASMVWKTAFWFSLFDQRFDTWMQCWSNYSVDVNALTVRMNAVLHFFNPHGKDERERIYA